jgi:energy-coupling factor transporter ATP-binding protein EcfA2
MNKKKKTEDAAPEPKRSVHLHKLVMKITEPMKMDMEIELGALAVMLGANDSGKSFLLKIAYALSMIGATPEGPMPVVPAAQFVLDNTFTGQNLNGTIRGEFTTGHVDVDVEKGQVVGVGITVKNPTPIIYMSTDMRTFDQMNLYLKMKKECGTDPLISMRKMLEAYRLYDLTYMEALIMRCPIKISEMTMEILSGYDFKEKITSIEADMESCTFSAVLEDGSKRNLATYGKGHQAILNMIMGVSAP